ncbi:NACHT domain-containing protein [Fusarium pseudocircinatum]|uniref:NACHT domain-containing protein n=1 Tax=Fusarium pseudocircinatum TaxID=56676 RepID=A0A8H5LCB4_9HYPO|nr:NACHT domain-containing protein [Fusarium pseudocircinatum]
MSGLEPLAALGLVCNVLQLVEVGLKTATLCKNAYRTGEPDPDLSIYAQNLAAIASSLSQNLEASPQPLKIDDLRLLVLARNCRDAEAEWRKKTPARFLSQQPRKRDRFGAVFRGIIKKPEIDRLESQLQKAKDSLETDLLVGIFKGLDVSKVQANDLQDKFRDLLQAISKSEKKLHGLIQAQVALVNTQLSDRIDQAEASAKAHITTELASHASRLKSHADQGKDTILIEAEARENIRRENEDYERLLRSFQYPDMNRRRNEIHASYGSTFNWLFEGELEDDHLESEASQLDSISEHETEYSSEDELDSYRQMLARSSFGKWLESTENRYWISGRPGTGKSVLMKFIISHKQTMDSLRKWQPEAQPLSHFFWKVGSPMQSSFKGFLCSLVYQAFSLDKGHALGCLQQNPDWSRKAGPDDWDKEDLQSQLRNYARQPARSLCIFIDGIDELMDDEGVGTIIGFLDALQEPSRLVKVCMSSRPESAIRKRVSLEPDLKMQDLTRVDIQRYVRGSLEREVCGTTPSAYVDGLVEQISDKAEGVFLWAILVTRSIVRGIINGDSKDDARQRLHKTPKKIHELYLDMWTRLDEDSDLYQSSTSLIFRIVLFNWQSSHRPKALHFPLYISRGPISILELMLASSDNLWSTPANHFDRLSAADLERRCNDLSARLPFRTANLFEIIDTTEHERLDEPDWVDKSHLPVFKYDKLKVVAMHRTVLDFLIETVDGKKIMEHHKASYEEMFVRTFRSRLIRDCLRPRAYFYINEEDGIFARRCLAIQLQTLPYHADSIRSSTLVEMLDLIWASFVEMTKKFPPHPDLIMKGGVPTCKLDYLLHVAPKGFDAYIRDYLIEWQNTQQFDALYKVLVACLESSLRIFSDFEWSGRQRLIQRILRIVVSSDRFYISLPIGLQLSSEILVKSSIASNLIFAIDNFQFSQFSKYSASLWGANRTNAILGFIKEFRHSLCLGDRILVALYMDAKQPAYPSFISCRRVRESGNALYVEVSLSVLIRNFLQLAFRDDAAFNRHEAEDALDLNAFPHTIRPVMLGVKRGYFLELSGRDLPVFHQYCNRNLLPGHVDPWSGILEEIEWCTKQTAKVTRYMKERDNHTGSLPEMRNGMEEGIGPHGMNFYLCDACKTRERT